MAAPGAVSPKEVAACFGMAPKDAVAFFEAKGYQLTFSWADMWQEAHTRAFTVTSVARMDVLEDIRKALETAAKEGKTSQWFADQLTPKLKEKGWWGTRVDVDEDGNARKVHMGSPKRLELIYRQNMATAYNAGRYKQQLANAKYRPYWQYIAVEDDKTRITHRALHGCVFRYDDPIWQYIYPPNDWQCRCRIRALSELDVKRKGLTVLSSEGRMLQKEVEVTNLDTGVVERRTVHGIRLPNGVDVYTGTGFSYNPGAAAFGTDMELARKLNRVQSPDLYKNVVQSINNAPLRHEQFAREAAKILDTRRAGSDSLAVGLVDIDIADFVRAKGHEPATILVMPEKALLHAARPAHAAEGIALERAEYLAIPRMIAQPEMVLWDIRHNSVVYVYKTTDPKRRIVIPAYMPANGKSKRYAGQLDAIVNAYSTSLMSLQNTNWYERIR
ncbi:minor capsid protein [Desulfovibrio sp. OttesenSCG-928-G15]|nr:minor capsid protein [Desulfovibrio sp. OttesenSCG-928-G15]